MREGVPIVIPIGNVKVNGDLNLIKGSEGIVIFAYGAGSSRFSPRERFVSEKLNGAGISTLFMDLLTKKEEEIDEVTTEYRFDIPLLADRLNYAVEWVKNNKDTKNLKIGLFGGSTGASACLIAAGKRPSDIAAIISRGGRTDLADTYVPKIKAAILLIVGGDDEEILALNKTSFKLLKCQNKKLEIVKGATHLFEEPGKLEEVAKLSIIWFKRYLK